MKTAKQLWIELLERGDAHLNANPNHDKLGRFTTDGGSGDDSSKKDEKKRLKDKIAREANSPGKKASVRAVKAFYEGKKGTLDAVTFKSSDKTTTVSLEFKDDIFTRKIKSTNSDFNATMDFDQFEPSLKRYSRDVNFFDNLEK